MPHLRRFLGIHVLKFVCALKGSLAQHMTKIPQIVFAALRTWPISGNVLSIFLTLPILFLVWQYFQDIVEFYSDWGAFFVPTFYVLFPFNFLISYIIKTEYKHMVYSNQHSPLFCRLTYKGRDLFITDTVYYSQYTVITDHMSTFLRYFQILIMLK